MGEHKYPRGKFNADDEGAVKLAVTTEDNTVIINFEKPVHWIGMGKADAIEFAMLLMKHAGVNVEVHR